MKRVLTLLLILFLFESGAHAQEQFRALLVTTIRGWHHESVHHGVLAMKKLAARHQFRIDLFEDPTSFTDNHLKNYQVVIFLNTTGDIFDSTQQKVMERFIQSGKGYVGIHSASDTEYGWAWYTKLVGRMFTIHPPTQTAAVTVIDSTFKGVKGFATDPLWTDEWYEFGPELTSGLQYILGVDESTYRTGVQWGNKVGKGMGAFHPQAWYQLYDGGRSFYTALGHLPASFSDERFLQHIYAGLFWAATGRK